MRDSDDGVLVFGSNARIGKKDILSLNDNYETNDIYHHMNIGLFRQEESLPIS